MRADRLVTALLILQARGRVTAAQLAAELEVSVRTARRDLEALSVAGVPVYASRGTGGGWSLVGGARTDLTGLSSDEARALFLVAGAMARLDPDARSALRKLVQAIPEPFRAGARSAASAMVLDPDGWGGRRRDVPPRLDLLRRAVIDRRVVRLTYAGRDGRVTDRTIHPLGVVRKGSGWYLAAATDDGTRTFRLDRVLEAVVTDEPAVIPDGFDLAEHWRSVVETVETRRRRVTAVAYAAPAMLPGLRETFGEGMTVGDTLDDGRVEVRLRAASARILADELAGYGADALVIRPRAVRRELARIGADLTTLYGDP